MDEIHGANESIVVMMYACVLPKEVRDVISKALDEA